jgi:tRNA-Thr(GGU) m(6)t(6)A37 methyltransferase TsaA
MTFEISPIGSVRGGRTEVRDDFWGGTEAAIELIPAISPRSLDGVEEYSHAEILFVFDRVDPAKIEWEARYWRGRQDLGKVGIFAQRAKVRPNRIGATIVRILGRDGARLRVAELDAVDGTPVIDIKPVLTEFLPRSPLRQPAWTHDLLADYWKRRATDGA